MKLHVMRLESRVFGQDDRHHIGYLCRFSVALSGARIGDVLCKCWVGGGRVAKRQRPKTHVRWYGLTELGVTRTAFSGARTSWFG